jgi:hypothetical protein
MSYGINHQVGIKASPEEIYKALTETGKLAQWWTTDTRGSGAKVGTLLNFSFMASANNSLSRNLSRETVSPGNPRSRRLTSQACYFHSIFIDVQSVVRPSLG